MKYHKCHLKIKVGTRTEDRWLLVLSISILFSLASQPIADHRSASVRADFALNASKLQCWPSESKFQIAPAFNPIDPFVMIKSVLCLWYIVLILL